MLDTSALSVLEVLDIDAHSSTASVIRDMLCIKSRQAEIPGFSSNDVDFMLECLCVS